MCGLCDSSAQQYQNSNNNSNVINLKRPSNQQQGNTLNTIANVANVANALNSNNQQQGGVINPITNVLSSERKNGNMKEVSIDEAVDFITNGAFIPPNELDPSFHYIYTSGNNKSIGPPSHPKTFIPPIGWTALALNISKKYDNGDDKWIGNSNSEGEWYIGYHGVKTMNSINNIYFRGFIKGPRQECKNDENTNPLTFSLYPKCEEGAYFAQNINEAKFFSDIIPYLGNNYRVVFMCRINPYKVRISNKGINNDYMIVDGIDETIGKPRTDQVRPYKILLQKE